jgi:hypothetical protein
MKKAHIYFNGQIILTIDYELLTPDSVTQMNILSINNRMVALIPFNHMIVINND